LGWSVAHSIQMEATLLREFRVLAEVVICEPPDVD
jgi:hypothetical protein